MNNKNLKQSPAQNASKGTSNNPLARAMSETEQSLNQQPSALPQNKDNNSLLSQALANSGGKMGNYDSAEWQKRQAEEAEKKRKKEIMRKKLHDQINPTDLREVYDANQKKVAEELEKTRNEIELLVKEVSHVRKDLDIAAFQKVVNPGQEGSYYVSFFQQLRAFIIMLRQKVKSARTWMKQMTRKKAKKRRSKFGAGIDVAGKGHEQTKAIFESMNMELSSSNSGG